MKYLKLEKQLNTNYGYNIIVIDSGKIIGTAFYDVDGEYKYFPIESQGAYSWYVLIEIGELLKKLNDDDNNNPIT
jgi:hypothetical protein